MVSLLLKLVLSYLLVEIFGSSIWFEFLQLFVIGCMHILARSSYYIGSQYFRPFRQLLTMGEKFRGFKGNGFMLKVGLFLSVWLHAYLSLIDVLHG